MKTFFALQKILICIAGKLIYFILLNVFICFSALAETSSELTTPQLTQSSISALHNCLHYQITGACYWLTCKGSICHTITTLKVKHYLPDAVVSVYRKNNSNPWDYANNIIDPPAYQLGQQQMKAITGKNIGFGNESTSLPTDQNTHFKEVDVIGNPAVSIIKKIGHNWLIPSVATPFIPYYLSLADAYIWRSPLIEMARYPQNLIPGVDIVGDLTNNWGSVYPRTGFLIQPEDVKGAAVIAQRGASIATQELQPHIYHYLESKTCGTECKVSAAEENNKNTRWQMLYPIAENQCSIFGEQNYSDAQKSSDGNYVWILWRQYQGCIPGEGKYLGSTDI